LVLVKHAAPTIDASVPAPDWRLSPAGIAQCEALARRLRAFSPRRIATSVEPKAVETATHIGEYLGLPVELVDGLHEHDRRDTAFLGAEAFQRAVRSLFEHPNDLVFGRETAADALRRFDDAIGRLLATHGAADDVVVVTHGTVIALFVAARTGEDGFTLWGRLGLPSIVVLRRGDLTLDRVEANIP
jgi:broad specificity phosphatase PhoE